jgi:hypothetical protein
MSACIVAAQIIMVPMAMLAGGKADAWGRKPLLLAGSNNPFWLRLGLSQTGRPGNAAGPRLFASQPCVAILNVRSIKCRSRRRQGRLVGSIRDQSRTQGLSVHDSS